uniref:Secreted protein n=1 Tax=Achlya hypogyna TaxID=1202772 RepID=A0A0A7CMG6_ACHHY|nr:secreted protein [Achlya hypogyna]
MKTSFVALLAVCAIAAADQSRHLRSLVDASVAQPHVPSVDIVAPAAYSIPDESDFSVGIESLDDLSDLSEDSDSNDSDSAELVEADAHELLVALADTQALLTKVQAALDGEVHAKGWRDELAKLKNKTVSFFHGDKAAQIPLESGDEESSDSDASDIEITDIDSDLGFDDLDLTSDNDGDEPEQAAAEGTWEHVKNKTEGTWNKITDWFHGKEAKPASLEAVVAGPADDVDEVKDILASDSDESDLPDSEESGSEESDSDLFESEESGDESLFESNESAEDSDSTDDSLEDGEN